MDYVAHDMECGLLPGNEITVVPDLGSFLDRHGN